MANQHSAIRLLKNISILDIAAEGKAIAKVDDLVIFVPHAVPGDVVDLAITKQKKRFAEANVVNLVTPSPLRTQPFCQHYGVCGGCKWQILPYETQLQYKDQEVHAQLTRIGKVTAAKTLPIMPSIETLHYRNKTEFAFAKQAYSVVDGVDGGSNVLGYHVAGTYKDVLAIDYCHLQSDQANQVRDAILSLARAAKLSFWDYKKEKGLLRSVVLRENLQGQMMVTLVCQIKTPADEQAIRKLLTDLSHQFDHIVATFLINNPNKNAHYGALPATKVTGDEGLIEHMGDLSFHVGPKSFYQTNGKQALQLYTLAKDWAGLTGNERVYDLYTGTGTIALFVAQWAKEVIGIEYIKSAIDDAKQNAKRNNIGNAQFFAGDMKAILTTDFLQQHGAADVVITDPPRAGMDKEVIEVLLLAAPKRIVYISCNPATQARDLSLLSEHYEVSCSQAVDMFPQTHHVENVVLLIKK